ncbi:general glycosylation protein [Pseudomonadota bacterium]
MAVFDVSKLLLEEEVFDVHGEESSAKQGATLMNFIVIINIALLLEALVFIFTATKKDISLLVYQHSYCLPLFFCNQFRCLPETYS